jgi:hypothetical protein
MKSTLPFIFFSILSISNRLFSQKVEEEEIPILVEINPLIRNISYQMSFRPGYFTPLSGSKSYISAGDFQPLGLSFEVVMPKKYSIGVELNHQYFKQYHSRETYDYDGTLISTAQVRTLKLTSLSFFGNKYFANIDKRIRPYMQLGLGILKVNYIAYWGYLPDDRLRYKPLITPAIGLKLNLDKSNNWILETKIKYQYAPFKYDFISNISYLAADISLGFRWWKE